MIRTDEQRLAAAQNKAYEVPHLEKGTGSDQLLVDFPDHTPEKTLTLTTEFLPLPGKPADLPELQLKFSAPTPSRWQRLRQRLSDQRPPVASGHLSVTCPEGYLIARNLAPHGTPPSQQVELEIKPSPVLLPGQVGDKTGQRVVVRVYHQTHPDKLLGTLTLRLKTVNNNGRTSYSIQDCAYSHPYKRPSKQDEPLPQKLFEKIPTPKTTPQPRVAETLNPFGEMVDLPAAQLNPPLNLDELLNKHFPTPLMPTEFPTEPNDPPIEPTDQSPHIFDPITGLYKPTNEPK